MSLDLSQILVVGISSRSLFDLERENEIFETLGLRAYTDHQIENADSILKPGTGFRLVKNLLSLNQPGNPRKVEIIILSKNNAATSLRITKSIEHYELDIIRSAWVGGESLSKYLGPYRVDLFLSANQSDVQSAINAGFAAARVYKTHKYTPETKGDKHRVKIAFDGDAVLFSDESEKIYKEKGIEAFIAHEKENAKKPLPDGPFAPLLRAIGRAQSEFDEYTAPIRTALITARNSPSHERVVRTLHAWGVRIDEVHFLGGLEKTEFTSAFGADIFFDDQDVHCAKAAPFAPTGIVPWKEGDGV